MTNPPIKPSRSVYASRLREFAEVALADGAANSLAGRWRSHFSARMGARFDGRVILEIGCADAEFLARIASKNPQTALIGLDWKCKAIYDGAQRISEMSLNNVMLVRGRAQSLAGMFGAAEVDEIWIFHPDPCDREVELKNRLFAPAFLVESHGVLSDRGGHLVLKTDHPGYYQWTLALLGLPQPARFGAPQISPLKLRAGVLTSHKDLPARSAEIARRFDVRCVSDHFWQDRAALEFSAGRCFADEATPFESRFIKKRQPIYFVALEKKML